MNENTTHETDSPSTPFGVEVLLGDHLLTVKEVADRLRIGEKTAGDWIRKGILAAPRIGRHRYVTERVLRQFVEDADRRALEEAERRRRHEDLRRALKRLQAAEPRQGWMESPCIGCLGPALTNRHRRLDVSALCDRCTDDVRERGRTKEMIDRAVELEVVERNQMAEEELELLDFSDWARRQQARGNRRHVEPLREWILARCGWCQHPQVIRLARLVDPRFMLSCRHDPPYGEGEVGSADVAVIERLEMKAALAQLEMIELNRLEKDLDFYDPRWRVVPCAVCGDHAAVGDRAILLVGGARCRGCRLTRIGPYERLTAIINALTLHLPEIEFGRKTCPCSSSAACQYGSFELVSYPAPDTVRLVLSWCRSRSPEEKRELAGAYAKECGLSEPITRWLLEDVGQDDEWWLERPPLGPPLWPS